MEEHNQDNRINPVNEIDLAFLTTDPAWGKNQVPQEYLKELIQDKEVILAQLGKNGEIEILTDEHNKPITASDVTKAWSRLGYLIKDIRLGNLSRVAGDKGYCEYYLDLAGDLLEAGFPKAHITSVQRTAVKLEVSQSVGGFLRKRQGTLTTENYTNELDPEKKRGFFGGKKREE